MEGTATVSSIIGTVGSIFEAAIGWVGDVATCVTSNPILLIFAVIGLVGLGVGLFKRLLSVN